MSFKFAVCSLQFAVALAAPALAGQTIYIPGFLRCHSPRSGASCAIRAKAEASGDTYRYFDWDGNRSWPKSLANSDAAAKEFAAGLLDMPDEKLAATTIIGHSLGGRIALRALAIVARSGRKVKKAVVLGGAIPADDPDIEDACRAVRQSVVFVVNPRDITLGTLYGHFGGERSVAAGLAGPEKPPANAVVLFVDDEDMHSAPIDGVWGKWQLCRKMAAHHAAFYLHRLYRR